MSKHTSPALSVQGVVKFVMVVVLVCHKYEISGNVVAFTCVWVNVNYAPVIGGKAV